ncbi:related to 1-(5-phosphoribosyl)-5-[(5-phosphoribosylamino)methylideneamino] imidazole-4-carboxamide isomerase [Saccharomycodes ludwigii]|uniref:1-(5-phosphoribosyl)-5-[(5-phosphoribosylamino)methylideneamino] imidazole-4-carboxamide isomerase n=1 Tax=Saccharomycodes ludwigii TaxID=36035 RepID=A0A376B8M1_9ASCO|nr:hypothetical protein SCDLUD_002460 [Saccharomycodes ludwigii]KAH3900995.1 hypothetical protein SCDLUD_002460 [Saccharomycodes ludwigii]SSD61043.1 related to 1-(5-phosphoribosyl)-5-[(5-phosphoribosylamino)methylideneamino] imidazole-4-carboxamide isomerase [Saccharomycodes ludwigii]
MTKFVGCIDIHNGQVKQIVGSTLIDKTKPDVPTTTTQKATANALETNFVSTKPSSYYAQLYKKNNIESTHIILLDSSNTQTIKTAQLALETVPFFFQVGGGINIDNCLTWLNEYKARKIIITSYLFDFNTGDFSMEKLLKIFHKCGKSRDKIVIDLSCKKRKDSKQDDQTEWIVCFNKWQTLTTLKLNKQLFQELSKYTNEFLIHAADVEGLCKGVDLELIAKLGEWVQDLTDVKIVYAGGAKSINDLAIVKQLSKGKIDLTFGSSLDIFGGELVKFEDCCKWNREQD